MKKEICIKCGQESIVNEDGLCFSCAADDMVEEVEKAREEKKKRGYGVCKECGRFMYIKGKGLCGRCYSRLIEKSKKKATVPEKQEDCSGSDRVLLIDFSSYPELLEALREKALEEVRSPEHQIIWCIKKYVGV